MNHVIRRLECILVVKNHCVYFCSKCFALLGLAFIVLFKHNKSFVSILLGAKITMFNIKQIFYIIKM